MVVPSLRALGFIIGHAESIRISANGRLLVEANAAKEKPGDRAACAIFVELDERYFHFINALQSATPDSPARFMTELLSLVKAEGERQRMERARHWLALLKQAGLLKEAGSSFALNQLVTRLALKDLDYTKKSQRQFENFLLQSYKNSDPRKAGIVDIAALRESVALEFLREGEILTEKQFDDLLRETPLVTNSHLISFGSPMGSGNLFEYKGEKYRTLTIRFLRKD